MKEHPAMAVLLLGALAGFGVGFLGEPTWQTAVMFAQPLAGLVEYPPDNPWYLHQATQFTLVNQLSALALHVGFSERSVSFFLSGVLGAVSFAALSLTVWALCRDVVFSLLSSFFIYWAGMYRGLVVYPVYLIAANAPAVLGLAWSLASVALIATGRYRLGGFGLGLAPAFHGVHGGWAWVVAGVALVWGRRESGDLRRVALPFLAGCSVLGASGLFHLWTAPKVTGIDGEAAADFMRSFVRNWDGHRRPFELNTSGPKVCLISLVVSSVWLVFFKKDLSPGVRFLARTFMVSAILGGLLSVVHFLPPETVPVPLLKVMPGRVLNYNIIGLGALVLGLLRMYPGNGLAQAGLSGLLLAQAFLRGAFVLKSILLSGIVLGMAAWAGRVYPNRLAFPRGAALMGVLRYAALMYVVFSVGGEIEQGWGRMKDSLVDRTRDRFLERVSQEPGVVLPAPGFGLMQLFTRKALILSPDHLDFLPYVPDSGYELVKILEVGYGADFYVPGKASTHNGRLNGSFVRGVWEARSRADWQVVGHKLGGSGVLAPSDWKLDLPLLAEAGGRALYGIPN